MSEDDLAMAVVVMRMVDARRAGVIFTVDPAGRSTDMRIEAVDGLAEQLVSGEVTPDAWVVSRIAGQRAGIDPIVDDVIATALGIEARFGAPQDVEWAHDGKLLYVVQARPITTLGAAGVEAGDGFDSTIGSDDTYTTAGIAESMPDVLPPLQWTTAGPLLENGFRHLFDQMGALPARADDTRFLARVRGRAVLSLDLMKAAALEVPGGSSDEIERQYFGRVISRADDAAVEPKSASGPFKGLRSMLAPSPPPSNSRPSSPPGWPPPGVTVLRSARLPSQWFRQQARGRAAPGCQLRASEVRCDRRAGMNR